jgi:dolichol kinase
LLKKEEINRKLLHLFALAMPIGIFYIPRIEWVSLWVPPIVLFFLFGASLLLEVLRFRYPNTRALFLKYFQFLLRKNERRNFTGATYLIGGAALSSLVFVHAPHISFVMLTLFILGDAMAAIVGQSLGRIRFLGKTVEGSLACLLTCILLFSLLFPRIPLLFETWGHPVSWAYMLGTSFLITLLELIPVKITRNRYLNDNLYVPIATGLIMEGLYRLFSLI